MLSRLILALTMAPLLIAPVLAFGTPAEGLVAHYPLDYTAIDRFGGLDSALHCDGTLGTGVDLPDVPKPDFPVTITGWIKPDTIDQNAWIFRNDIHDGNSYYHGLAIKMLPSGILEARVGSGFAAPSTRVNVRTSVPVLADHKWTFFSVIYRSHDDIEIFVDNSLYATESFGSGTTMTYSSAPGAIAKGNSTGLNEFSGRLDDIRMYGRVLEPWERSELFHTPYLDGLMAHYRLDGNAFDESGNDNDGTPYGVVSSSDRFEIADAAMGFAGNSTSYVDLGSGLKASFPMTFAAWIKPDTLASQSYLFRNDEHDGNAYYHGVAVTVRETGQLEGRVGSGFASPSTRRNTITIDPVIAIDQWQHVAVVFLAHDDLRLFVNGVERSTEVFGSGTGMTYSNAPGALGNRASTGLGAYDGIMDDVRVYARALTDSEIRTLYRPNVQEGLLAWYGLNGDGADATGSQPDGVTFNVTGAPDRHGIVEQSMDFAGAATSYIDIGNALKPDFPVTICAWIRPDTNHNAYLFRNDQHDGNSYYHGLAMRMRDDGRFEARVGSGFAAPSTRRNIVSLDPVIQPGVWQHVAAVFHAYDQMTLYVNGRKRDHEMFGTGTGMTYSVSPGAIGKAATSQGFDGLMDDLRVYGAALDPRAIYEVFMPDGPLTDAPEIERGTILSLSVYPNPFNPATTVAFELGARAEVTLVIYDIRGRSIRQLASGSYSAGTHAVPWRGRDDRGYSVASGVYICEIRHNDTRVFQKMTLVE